MLYNIRIVMRVNSTGMKHTHDQNLGVRVEE